MMKPTVHLNGTSKASLAQQYENAAATLQAAIKALYEAAPNARDYYVQGPDAFNVAAREHAARAQTLAAVLADLQALWEHVEDS
jgi:hypothetical protein